MRERWDEPLARAARVTQRTLGWFPVRVWRHFLQHNGFLLSAGVSYQALFSFFAAVYVAFAGVGLWLGGSRTAIFALIDVINSYVPGVIGAEDASLISTEQVQEIARNSTSLLAVTGLVALLAAGWTAISFITFTRRAVRDIFGLVFDDRPYLALKARDLAAAIVFGLALVLGTLLTAIGTWSLRSIFRTLGWATDSLLFETALQIISVVVSLAINAGALAGLFAFLTGTVRRWGAIWRGSLVGATALTVLQLAAGLLLSFTPTNPLLATFTIIVGFLIWFRAVGIVILVAAAWIAVTADDHDQPLVKQTEQDRLWEEHQALLLAARVRVRTAREAVVDAPWYRRWSAGRALQQAREELAEVEADAPPPPQSRSWLLE